MKANICEVLGYPAGSKLRNLNPTYAGYLIHVPKLAAAIAWIDDTQGLPLNCRSNIHLPKMISLNKWLRKLLFVLLVGGDNALHQGMAHHIGFG
jgi:hypothetical protein